MKKCMKIIIGVMIISICMFYSYFEVKAATKIIEENFNIMPSFSSTFDSLDENPASWAITPNGVARSLCLQITATGTVISARTISYSVPCFHTLDVSVYIACPSYSAGYYRLGAAFITGERAYTAEEFINDQTDWTIIKEFSTNGENGNSGFHKYEQTRTSFEGDVMTVVFYTEATVGLPTVRFDNFVVMDNGPYLVIDTQPQDVTVTEGETATFTAAATGASPLSYRWQKDGVDLDDGGNISGAFTSTLTINSVQESDAGSYTVVVSNAEDSVTGEPATLTVNPVPTYTVTYNGNGGTGYAPVESEKTEGEMFAAAANTFTPPVGMQFREWNTEADGTGTGYQPGATVTMPALSITLYAVWEYKAPDLDADGYNPTLISIDEDDFTSSGNTIAEIVPDCSITYFDGSTSENIAIASVDNTNGKWQYSINGGATWLDVSDVTGSIVDMLENYLLLDENARLRFVPNANWYGTSTITYRACQNNGGDSTLFSESVETASIAVDAVNDAPSQPGDFISPISGQSIISGSDINVAWGEATDIDGDIIIYTVDFYDGDNWITHVYSGTGISFILSDTGGINTSSAKFRVKSYDEKVYSSYIESNEFIIVSTYTVTFNNWDGSELKSETVEHGNGATAPEVPAREGYYFIGWDTDFGNVTSGLTITALFEKYTYTIALSEIGTHTFASQTVGYTTVASITVTVTKTGTGTITNLSATLSGINADDFTLGALDAVTLDSTTTSAGFTVKPNDVLAPGTYTATVTVTADNDVSQSFNICFTVNAPSAPTIQSAAAGDTYVNITWSSVPGATGYKIYKSTVSGSYGEPIATVSDSVNNYNAEGLFNGTTYFFVVRASIGIYDSANSNEVSSTPQVPAPGAPVLQYAIAGDGQVNLTWSEVAGSIEYKIYVSTTSGLYITPVNTVAGSVNSCDVTDLTNGTTYYFVVTASNPGGESGYSNEISAMPQVSAPAAPTGITATAGNGKVILSWNEVTGVTEFTIYQSTTSGLLGDAIAAVTGSALSFEVTGLTNGVTYYFTIKAAIPGGDSPYSAEVSATPKTVPGALSNVSAVAGNGQATVSFAAPVDNGGSPITGYVLTSNPGNITAVGTGTSITVTGLTNGTAYTFTVKAVNEVGSGPESAESNAVTPNEPSSGENTGGEPTPEPTPESTPVPVKPDETGVEILVNGKSETAAAATTTKVEDKTVTTITVDAKKVEEKLESEGNNAVVTIPVKSDADVVVGQLNGQTVKNMETKEAVLEIKTGQITYTLPASQINIDSVSKQIGKQVELKDIAVSVKISEPAEDTVKIVEDTADKNNYQIIVEPIEFEITCSSGSKTVEVSKFSAYVERMIAIPEGVDPSKITTGVILNSDGTFSHVPTVITIIDGRYYAKINSLTNSTYLLIYSPKTFKDIEGHWAEKDINDMASRLVVSGKDNDKYEPDSDITRAEIAAIVVRALGLMRPGTGKDIFVDVMKKNWYYDAVSIAYEYGITSGYGNGKFGPDDKITREQAMTMIARAMKITGTKVELAEGEVDKLLTSFTDASNASEYAKTSIASCVKAGIISGRSGKLIAPKDNITRAEVAVIVQRLLRNSKLI